MVEAILLALSFIYMTLKRTPAILREMRKVAEAYYDLRDAVIRRRRPAAQQSEHELPACTDDQLQKAQSPGLSGSTSG